MWVSTCPVHFATDPVCRSYRPNGSEPRRQPDSGSWPWAARPPSTGITVPVIRLAPGDRRKATASALVGPADAADRMEAGHLLRHLGHRRRRQAGQITRVAFRVDRAQRHRVRPGCRTDRNRRPTPGSGPPPPPSRSRRGERRGPPAGPGRDEDVDDRAGRAAARKRRTATAEPIICRCQVEGDQRHHLGSRRGGQREVAEDGRVVDPAGQRRRAPRRDRPPPSPPPRRRRRRSPRAAAGGTTTPAPGRGPPRWWTRP